jgi:hypothetical protein
VIGSFWSVGMRSGARSSGTLHRVGLWSNGMERMGLYAGTCKSVLSFEDSNPEELERTPCQEETTPVSYRGSHLEH